jgi:hypothetical protein
MTSSEVGQVLHFQKTDLVQAAGKNVDNMPVVSRALGKGVVELN